MIFTVDTISFDESSTLTGGFPEHPKMHEKTMMLAKVLSMFILSD